MVVEMIGASQRREHDVRYIYCHQHADGIVCSEFHLLAFSTIPYIRRYPTDNNTFSGSIFGQPFVVAQQRQFW